MAMEQRSLGRRVLPLAIGRKERGRAARGSLLNVKMFFGIGITRSRGRAARAPGGMIHSTFSRNLTAVAPHCENCGRTEWLQPSSASRELRRMPHQTLLVFVQGLNRQVLFRNSVEAR